MFDVTIEFVNDEVGDISILENGIKIGSIYKLGAYPPNRPDRYNKFVFYFGNNRYNEHLNFLEARGTLKKYFDSAEEVKLYLVNSFLKDC